MLLLLLLGSWQSLIARWQLQRGLWAAIIDLKVLWQVFHVVSAPRKCISKSFWM